MDTTLNLNAELFRQLSYIANDENSMKKLLAYAKKLVEKKAEAPIMTKAEIMAEMEEAFHFAKLVKEKKTKGRPVEELLHEL